MSVGDWTAVRAILASSVNSVRAGDWTAVRAILASRIVSVQVIGQPYGRYLLVM